MKGHCQKDANILENESGHKSGTIQAKLLLYRKHKLQLNTIFGIFLTFISWPKAVSSQMFSAVLIPWVEKTILYHAQNFKAFFLTANSEMQNGIRDKKVANVTSLESAKQISIKYFQDTVKLTEQICVMAIYKQRKLYGKLTAALTPQNSVRLQPLCHPK